MKPLVLATLLLTPPDASTPGDTPSIDATVATPDTFAWPDTPEFNPK